MCKTEIRHQRKIKVESFGLRGTLKKVGFALPFSWLVNSLLALETLLPMSARERKLDFLVWWRCFRSKVYMTFSFRSAFSWPHSIWLSVINSVRGTDQDQVTLSFFSTFKGDLLCFSEFYVLYTVLQWWVFVLNVAKVSNNEVNVRKSNPCEQISQALDQSKYSVSNIVLWLQWHHSVPDF